MSGWTVYDHPLDYPSGYVARRWIANRDGTVTPTRDVLLDPNLASLRAMLPPGLARIERMPEDDPVIIEVWL